VPGLIHKEKKRASRDEGAIKQLSTQQSLSVDCCPCRPFSKWWTHSLFLLPFVSSLASVRPFVSLDWGRLSFRPRSVQEEGGRKKKERKKGRKESAYRSVRETIFPEQPKFTTTHHDRGVRAHTVFSGPRRGEERDYSCTQQTQRERVFPGSPCSFFSPLAWLVPSFFHFFFWHAFFFCFALPLSHLFYLSLPSSPSLPNFLPPQ